MMTLSIGCLRRPFLVALDPMGVGSTSCSTDDGELSNELAVDESKGNREISFTPPSLPTDLELARDEPAAEERETNFTPPSLSTDFDLVGEEYYRGKEERKMIHLILTIIATSSVYL